MPTSVEAYPRRMHLQQDGRRVPLAEVDVTRVASGTDDRAVDGCRATTEVA